MTPEREAQMREAFEDWALKTSDGNCCEEDLQRYDEDVFELGGEYVEALVQRDWLVWLACARALEPMVRDGERYQWLRVNSGYSIRCNLFGETPMYKHKDSDLDEAIDKAMSAALEDGNAEH
ncbi:hypothetical protein GNZ10_13755 [Ralstonia sp. 3N]|uniref:hypothetical protein n=1 Tax=Ralstonia sp. 3N TaxID=2675750 RepID=UPI0015C5323B|nr:hypothetical protein [Ralstonia sp. 3N]NPT50762.1 hypothetical protein [Ralstonia sp. 3N]